MERKTLGIFAFAIVAILAIGAVSAFGGFGNTMSEEERLSMRSAVESGDYDSWASIKQNQISKEKFDESVIRHQERAEFRELMQEARESGDYDRIQELKTQYGAGKGMHRKNANSGDCPFK